MTVYRFNSLTEFANEAERHKGRCGGDKKWMGGETEDQVIHNLRNGGDVKYAEKAAKYLDEFNVAIDTEGFKFSPSRYGGKIVIPEAIIGWPEPARMLDRTAEDSFPLTVWVSNTCSAGISADDMIKRGMAIMAFVMAMSYKRQVKVVYFSELYGNDADKWCNITFDVPTAPMSLAEAAYCLGSMALTRGCVYSTGYGNGSGFNGMWAGHYERLGGPRKSPEYIQFLEEKLGARQDDLILGGVYLDDPIIKDPVNWIKSELGKRGVER